MKGSLGHNDILINPLEKKFIEGPLGYDDMLINPLALDLVNGVCGTTKFIINPDLNNRVCGNQVNGYVLIVTPPHNILEQQELEQIIYRINLHFHNRKNSLSYSMHMGDAEYYGEVEDYWFERDPSHFVVLAHVEYKTPGKHPYYVYRTAILSFDQAREDMDVKWLPYKEATESIRCELFNREMKFMTVHANNYPYKMKGVYMPDTMIFNNDEW